MCTSPCVAAGHRLLVGWDHRKMFIFFKCDAALLNKPFLMGDIIPSYGGLGSFDRSLLLQHPAMNCCESHVVILSLPNCDVSPHRPRWAARRSPVVYSRSCHTASERGLYLYEWGGAGDLFTEPFPWAVESPPCRKWKDGLDCPSKRAT